MSDTDWYLGYREKRAFSMTEVLSTADIKMMTPAKRKSLLRMVLHKVNPAAVQRIIQKKTPKFSRTPLRVEPGARPVIQESYIQGLNLEKRKALLNNVLDALNRESIREVLFDVEKSIDKRLQQNGYFDSKAHRERNVKKAFQFPWEQDEPEWYERPEVQMAGAAGLGALGAYGLTRGSQMSASGDMAQQALAGAPMSSLRMRGAAMPQKEMLAAQAHMNKLTQQQRMGAATAAAQQGQLGRGVQALGAMGALGAAGLGGYAVNNMMNE